MSTTSKLLRAGCGMVALFAIVAFAQARVLAAHNAPSACAGQQFSDVCPGDWYYSYVTDLASSGSISGYADGTFRPNSTITRGQVVKVVVLALGVEPAPPSEQTFTDVPTTNPFYQWIEAAAAANVVSGYDCGGNDPCDSQHRQYFHPSASVNRGQIAKMVSSAMAWAPITPHTPTFQDVPSTSPYFQYVETAVHYGAIDGYSCGAVGEPCPGRYFRPMATTTRAQSSKLIDTARRLRPTPTSTATPTPCSPIPCTSTPTPSSTMTRTATRTFTRTSTPAATSTPGGGPYSCQLFPSDNIWNRNISALPTHTLSNSYIASIGLSTGLHADFGSGLWDGGPIGIPYVVVPTAQPRVNVTFDYSDESDPGPYPVPTNAPIEGGPQSTGDRHVLVVQSGSCSLYEMFSSYPNTDGSWNAGSGAKWSLFSNALRPNTWTSADAAGLPILPGLANYDEAASGAIHHALRFTVQRSQRAYLWPARHYASSLTDPTLPPMGLRVRLKASVDISGYPTQLRVILQAMKDYGMFVADNGSNWYISGAPDERWNNDILHQISNIHGSDFEAVDESSLMIDPNSGQSR